MLTFLLVMIYLAFISLGLPDSLLGSAWPVMRLDLNMPLSAAGVISMIITGGTIVSSFLSGRLIARWGTGRVTLCSVFMTAVALLGFSASGSFWMLCLLAVPLGLGAGAVDSALNNFVALHYKARQMSWLHCFWGIGATSGPLILSAFMRAPNGWRWGYLVIAVIQSVLTFALFATLPAWKRVESPCVGAEEQQTAGVKINELIKLPVVRASLGAFFCYCALELTTGLWASSFLVAVKNISPATAAGWTSLFYLGITIGRFLSGFLTLRWQGSQLVRGGIVLIGTGILLLWLPLPAAVSMPGLVLIGLGCAPVYPCMLHDTPRRVGEAASQALMGIQMGVAYIGSSLMPPLFGVLAGWISPTLLPAYLMLLALVMLFCSERMNVLTIKS